MKKNTKILISALALIFVLLVGKEVLDSNKNEEKISELETKIESLEKDLNEPSQDNSQVIEERKIQTSDEVLIEENITTTQEPFKDDNNFYDANNLRIIEKTYKDGNTKKSLVIASTITDKSNQEFSDIPSLSNMEYIKYKTEFYSIFKGELLGFQEIISLEDDDKIYATYEKIDFDNYQITKRNILSPESLTKYSYENYSDNVEIKVYSLKEVLDESLIKAKYTFSDLLKIIVELDGKIENKVEDIITNKLIKNH